jgi:hypothetical protein
MMMMKKAAKYDRLSEGYAYAIKPGGRGYEYEE